MAHVHPDGILTMARNNVVKGIEIPAKSKDTDICEACIAGKMQRAPIPCASTTRAEGLLDLIHTDVGGPLPVPSKGGSLYFVTFIDDRSRYLTVFPIKSKSDCWRSISPRFDLRTRVTRMCASCHILLACKLCDVAHYTCITHDVANYT